MLDPHLDLLPLQVIAVLIVTNPRTVVILDGQSFARSGKDNDSRLAGDVAHASISGSLEQLHGVLGRCIEERTEDNRGMRVIEVAFEIGPLGGLVDSLRVYNPDVEIGCPKDRLRHYNLNPGRDRELLVSAIVDT